MKLTKKIISVAVSLLLSLAAVTTALFAVTENASASDETGIFFVDSAVKVLQNSAYTGDKLSSLKLSMSRGETESVQIIVAPQKTVKSVKIKAYDLVDGFARIPQDDISVYWEKYAEIVNKYNENPSYLLGDYVPDALLPMDTAVEYKENRVRAGENQGIWIDVKTYSDTPAGNYTGKFDVIIDGTTYTQTLNVKVWDIDLSTAENTFNYWDLHGRDSFATNEMDSSDEMATYYFEKLLDYNIVSNLPFCGIGGATAYAELIKKYYNHPAFSCYRFFYQRAVYWTKGKWYYYVRPDVLKEYIEAVVRLSLDDNVNYLDKAFFWLGNCVDEPWTDYQFDCVRLAYSRLHETLSECAEELAETLKSHSNYWFYVDTVKRTVANIPMTLAESMPTVSHYIEDEMDIGYITHMNLLGFFDTNAKRNEYEGYKKNIDDGDEYDTKKYCYTCVSPQYPYPSNHLDDDVIGLRTLFWMTELYGIDGHFNWAVAEYLEGTNVDFPRDPYTTTQILASGKLPQGDGFILYPGYPYGIKGPVSSIRAANIRDGVDDVKYMKIIKAMYEEKGVGVDDYLADICSAIFTGTKNTATPYSYQATREQIINDILSLGGDFGVYYNRTEIKQNNVNLSFATNDENAEVWYKGNKLTALNGIYTITQSLAESGTISYTLKVGGVTKTIDKYITGSLTVVSGFESNADADKVSVNNVSSKTITAERADMGTKSLKLVLNKSGNNLPYFKVNSATIGNLAAINEIYLSVYNAGAADLTFTVQTFIGTRYVTVESYTLKANSWNYITLSGVSNWIGVDKVSGIFFFIDDGDDNSSARTLYIDNLAYSLK